MFFDHLRSENVHLYVWAGTLLIATSTQLLIGMNIRDTFKNIDDALFLSLDNLWITTHDLYATISGERINMKYRLPTHVDRRLS